MKPVTSSYFTYWSCIILSTIWAASDAPYAAVFGGIWLVIALYIMVVIKFDRPANKDDLE